MNYQIIFNIIKKHIDSWDCMMLLSSNSPLDEYDIESKEIADNINMTDIIEISQLSLLIKKHSINFLKSK